MGAAEKVGLSLNQVEFTPPYDWEQEVPLVVDNSGGAERIAFKMKSTRVRRFAMRPGFEYVEPGEKKIVALRCKSFAASRLSVRDRFTILIVALPPDTRVPLKPADFWKGGAKQPRNPRRVPLPVRYRPLPPAASSSSGTGTGTTPSGTTETTTTTSGGTTETETEETTEAVEEGGEDDDEEDEEEEEGDE